MKRKDRNKELSFSRFLRYKKGEMSGEERNSFERELQRDPFASEAQEGFELVQGADVESDMTNLEAVLMKRIRRRKVNVIYRIAATIAVLMIVSSIFIVLDRNKVPEQPLLSDRVVVMEIEKPEPVRETIGEEKQVVKEKSPVVERSESYEISDVAEAVNEKETEAPERIPEIKREDPGLAVNEAIPAELAEPAAARRSVRKEAAGAAARSKATGTVISAEDNMPIPGASVTIKGTTAGVITDANGNFSIEVPDKENITLVASFIGMTPVEMDAQPGASIPVIMTPDVAALSEVVVVGYGTSGKAGEDVSPSYKPPRPEGGNNSFDKYITENLRRPDSSTTGQRVVVVAGFRVRHDGSIDSIRIIRSPDKSFSEEAIRLIRQGPAWLPAERDGTAIEDNVRVRIVFR